MTKRERQKIRALIRSRVQPLPAWTPPDPTKYHASVAALDKWLRRIKPREYKVVQPENLQPRRKREAA